MRFRFPQARFLIVGDAAPTAADYKDDLKRHAARLGIADRVVFTGFRIDIPKVLAEVSISVLPSLSEGLSNTLLESQAAGVPVVATSVGGNPEVVEDRVTGLLVQPGDAEALAHAICHLIENPETARRYGQAGKQRVAEHFDVDRMVKQTQQHYLELLDSLPAEKSIAH